MSGIAGWKAVDERWQAVDHFVAARLLPDDKVLDDCLARCEAVGLPDIAVSAAQGAFLQMMVTLTGARRVLEIGTLGGYSTIHLARGLAEGGRVVTLESQASFAEVALANFRAAGLAERIELRVEEALVTLPNLTGPFDLAFIDADKPSNCAYVDHALRLSRPGSLIVVDNVVREGTILDPPDDDESAIGTRALYEHVSHQDRLEATALQTVGGKGWDGMMFLRVKP